MSHGKTIVSGLQWAAVIVYVNRAFSLLTLLVLAKVVSPRDFGIVAIASMIIEFLRIAKDFGFGEALIYQKDESREAIDTAHTILVGFGVVLFLLAAAGAPFAARYYSEPLIVPVVIIMASSLVWDASRAVPRAIYRKRVDYRALLVPEVVPVVVAALVSVVMAVTGFGVWSLVVRAVLNSALGALLLRTPGMYRPRLRFHREHARALFGYGRYVAGTAVLLVILYNIDKFFVSSVVGLAAVGVFELALRIAELPVKEVSFVIGSVMFPVFSKMQTTGDMLRTAFLKTLKYTAMVSVPLAVGISLFGPDVIDRIYGARWAGLTIPLQVLALYAMFRSLSSIIYDMFKATGRPHLMQRFTLGRLAAIGLLGIPALKIWGVNGICFLLLATYIGAFLSEFTVACSILGMRVAASLGVIAKPMILSAATMSSVYFATVALLGRPSLVHLIAGGVMAAAAFALSIVVFDRRTIVEIRAAVKSRSSAMLTESGQASAPAS